MNKYEHIKKLNEFLKQNDYNRRVSVFTAPIPQKTKEKLKTKNK